MKAIIIIIFLFTACNENKKPNNDQYAVPIIKVKLDFVHFEIETPINVTCEKFSQFFGDINSKEIIKPGELNDFWNFISELKKLNKKYDGNMDIRGNATVFYKDGHIERYCIGTFGANFNGHILSYNDKITEYLIKLFE